MRSFKHVPANFEVDKCEREVSRMLQLIRHLFYGSGNLLLPFVEQSFEVSTAGTSKNVKSTQAEKLMNLFGQILEELGAQKQYEPVICEALMTMITFASLNYKFKNCFVQPIGVST